MALRDFGPGDRLDEIGFELPLVGGDTPSGDLSVPDVAEVLRAHLGADDILADYADRLDDPSLDKALRGYLTGSLDLVVRLPGDRFAVVDYKTNWLGGSSGTVLRCLELPPLRVDRRDVPGPLPAPGPAVLGRPPPLPPVATPGL